MVDPIRRALEYAGVGRKLIMVDELPPGAVARYERTYKIPPYIETLRYNEWELEEEITLEKLPTINYQYNDAYDCLGLDDEELRKAKYEFMVKYINDENNI